MNDKPLDVLRVEIVGDTSKLDSALNDLPKNAKRAAGKTSEAFGEIGESANDAAKKVGGIGDSADKQNAPIDGLKGGFAAFATAAVASATAVATALGGIGMAAVDVSSQLNGLATKFGEDGKEIAAAAEELFRSGVAGSLSEAIDAISKARQQLVGLAAKDLPEVSAGILRISKAFDQDFGKTAQAAQALMKEFGLSSTDAMAMLTKGFRDGLNANDDMLDSIGEYAPQFKQAGANASQFFSAMKTGLGGVAIGVDKLPDLFKEMQAVFADGDKAKKPLEELGLNFVAIKKSVDSGKTSMAQYFELVRDKLKGLKSVTDQQRIGTTLLGTQFEDMGRAAVYAVDVSGKAFADLGKSTQLLGKAPISAAEQWRSATAQMQLALKPVGDALLIFAAKAIPAALSALKSVGDWFKGFAPLGQKFAENMALIGESLKPLAPIAKATLGYLWELLQATVSALKKVLEAAVDFGTMMVSLFRGDIDGAVKYCFRSMNAFADGIGGLFSKLVGGLDKMAADWAVKWWDIGVNATKSLVDGFTDGFKSAKAELNRQLVQATGGLLGDVSAPSKYVAPKRNNNSTKPADVPVIVDTPKPKPAPKPAPKVVTPPPPKPVVSKPVAVAPTDTAALAKQFAIDPKLTTAALDAAKKAGELAKKEATVQQKAIEKANTAIETSVKASTAAVIAASKAASEELKKQRAEVVGLFTSAAKTAQGLAGRGQFDATAISAYNGKIAEAVQLAKKYNLGNDTAVKNASNASDAIKSSAKVLNTATLERIKLIEQQKAAEAALIQIQKQSASEAAQKAVRAATDKQLADKIAAQSAVLKAAASGKITKAVDVNAITETIRLLEDEQARRAEVAKQAAETERQKVAAQKQIWAEQKKDLKAYLTDIAQLREAAQKAVQAGTFSADDFGGDLKRIKQSATDAGVGAKSGFVEAVKAAEAWGKKAVEWNKTVAKEIILRGEQEKLASQKANNALANDIANASTPQLKQALSVASGGKAADFEKYNLVSAELEARSKAITNLTADLKELQASAAEGVAKGIFDADALQTYQKALNDIADDAKSARVAGDLAPIVAQTSKYAIGLLDAAEANKRLFDAENQRLDAVEKLSEAESKARVEALKSADIVALSKAAVTSTAAWVAELKRLGLTADEASKALDKLGTGKALIEQTKRAAMLQDELEGLQQTSIADLESQLASLDSAVGVDGQDIESARKYTVIVGVLADKYEDLAKSIKEARDAGTIADVIGDPVQVIADQANTTQTAQRITPLQDLSGLGAEGVSVWAKYLKATDDASISAQLLAIEQEKLAAIVANDSDWLAELNAKQAQLQTNLAKTVMSWQDAADAANSYELAKQAILNPVDQPDFARMLSPEIDAWIASADETNSTLDQLRQALGELDSRKMVDIQSSAVPEVAPTASVAEAGVNDILADILGKFDVSGVFSGILGKLDPIAAVFGAILEKLAPAFEALLKPILEAAGYIADALKPALMALKPLFDALAPILRALGEALGKALLPVVQIVVALLAPLMPVIKFVADVINAIVGVFKGIFDFITGAFGWLFGGGTTTPTVDVSPTTPTAPSAGQKDLSHLEVNVTVNNVYQVGLTDSELLKIQRLTTATINDVLISAGLIQANLKGGIQ